MSASACAALFLTHRFSQVLFAMASLRIVQTFSVLAREKLETVTMGPGPAMLPPKFHSQVLISSAWQPLHYPWSDPSSTAEFKVQSL